MHKTKCGGAAMLRAATLAGLLLAPLPAQTADPFVVRIGVENQTAIFRVDSFEESFRTLDGERLARAFPGYSETTPANADILYRGLPMRLNFPDGSTRLVFRIGALGLDRTFEGSTRDASVEQFRRFLKRSGDDLLRRLARELVRRSPIDPIAGNPHSLMAGRVSGDFERGFKHKVSQVWGCGSSAFLELNPERPLLLAAAEGGEAGLFEDWEGRFRAQRAENELALGVNYGITDVSDFSSSSISLPLAYTLRFDSDPRRKLRVEMPLTLTDAEGARSYALALGLNYTHPLSANWSLTPAVGVGVTGSDDLGSGGGIGSLSLASSYSFRLGGWAINIGNLIGHYRSLDIKVGDFQSTPDIANTALTNGVLLSGPGVLLSRGLVLEYFLTDTRLFGDDLYVDAYDEIGIALGRVGTRDGQPDSLLRASLSYLFGKANTVTPEPGFEDLAPASAERVSGLRLALSYRF